MKKRKKIIITILSIIILFGILVNKSEAENETTNSEASQNSEQGKSSNANLSNLGIKPNDFKGFKPETTAYEVAVPENVAQVEVYATTQDKKAKLTGTGKKSLEKGENEVQVEVTAEDGSKKTYTISIIREVKQESYEDDAPKTNEDSKENTDSEGKEGLAELKIDNLSLSPEFKSNVYEYTVKYIGEDIKLDLQAEPIDESYIVEVIGNDNLQEGENIITILVSEKNGNNVATYQITVNKSLVDEEAIAKEEAEKKEEQQKILIGGIAGGVGVLFIVMIVVIVIRRNRKLEDEFPMDFNGGLRRYDDFDEDEENYYDNDAEDEEDDELPMAFKEKNVEEEIGYNLQKNIENLYKEDEVLTVGRKEEEFLEEDFDKMSKDKVKEAFLKGYTLQAEIDIDDIEDNRYQNKRRKEKHKGKRFK